MPSVSLFRWLCLSLALPMLTGVVLAAPPDLFTQLDQNEDGVLSGTEARWFPRLDTNRDGEVTRDEFAKGAARRRSQLDQYDNAMFASRDRNQDGRLSGTELSGFEFTDQDGDGRVLVEEFRAGVLRQRAELAGLELPQVIAKFQERFGLSDLDRDGKLAGDELAGWEHLDANGDGAASLEEMVGALLLDLAGSTAARGRKDDSGPPESKEERAWLTVNSQAERLSFEMPGKPERSQGEANEQITYMLELEALQCQFGAHVFTFEQPIESKADEIFAELATTVPEAVGGPAVSVKPAPWKEHPGQILEIKLGEEGVHLQRDIVIGSRMYSLQWTAGQADATLRRDFGMRFLASFGIAESEPKSKKSDAPKSRNRAASTAPAPPGEPAPAERPTAPANTDPPKKSGLFDLLRDFLPGTPGNPEAPPAPAARSAPLAPNIPAAPAVPPPPFPGTAAAGGEAERAQQAAVDAIYPVMLQAVAGGDFAKARGLVRQCITYQPREPVHYYNLACIEARDEKLEPALQALQQAADLGFAEPDSMAADRDLDFIRRTPRYTAIAQAIARNAGQPAGKVPSPPAAHSTPPSRADRPSSRPTDSPPLSAAEQPSPARFATGAPVGLYFMTRFDSFSGSLEKAVWYFAPDGTVYERLETGFSAADLAAHQGRKGNLRVDGDQVTLRWADGNVLNTQLERNETGFFMDLGNFVPVSSATTPAMIAGQYEGGESAGPSADRSILSKSLTLNPDGTFVWNGAALIRASGNRTAVRAGAAGEISTGRWTLSGYSLTLQATDGTTFRRIAFPYDDENTPVQPDWLYFGGLMYKKQPAR